MGIVAELAGEVCKADTEQWFFFIPRQEREARGGRPSRTTGSGYWKATGSPSYVYSSDNRVIGVKKTMVFYNGKAPTGRKTKWKMHEYRAIEADPTTVDCTPAIPKVCYPQFPLFLGLSHSIAYSHFISLWLDVEQLRHEFSLSRIYVVSGSFRAFDRRPLGTSGEEETSQRVPQHADLRQLDWP